MQRVRRRCAERPSAPVDNPDRGGGRAAIPMRDNTASLEEQISAAARPALDAWHARGLGGSIPFGPNEVRPP